MANYLANQIILGNLNYTTVVTKYPNYKVGIDAYLNEKGRADLIAT